MTTEEIFEYNKRCALFLGWKETTDEFKIAWLSCKTKERLFRTKKEYIPILEKDGDVLFQEFTGRDFYNDWHWIMEVVNKIENGLDTFDTFSVDIVNRNQCEIVKNGEDYICGFGFDTIHHSKKEAVIQTINQFLIWYGQNK